MLAQELLDILACPVCKGFLTHQPDEASSLHCTLCCLSFPIRDGIPVLLVDEAEHIS